jgi:hypothetical protein
MRQPGHALRPLDCRNPTEIARILNIAGRRCTGLIKQAGRPGDQPSSLHRVADRTDGQER